jgi:polar amino acid transport system substrate-binding protein
MRIAKLCGIVPLSALLLLIVPASAQQQSSLQKIKQTGTIKACIAQTNPESFKDGKTGDWRGINVDLINELASWIKVKVEFVETKWDTLILSVNRNDCDMFGGSLQYNAPRSTEIAFIQPFWKKGSNLVIKKENAGKFKKWEEMNDPSVKISAVAGTSDAELVKRYFPKAQLLALSVNSSIQVMDSIRRGDADAAFVSSAAIRWWLEIPENSAWATEAFPGPDLFPATVGWAIRYGDPDFKAFLDAFANWAVANGRVAALYADYYSRTNPFKPAN